MYENRRYLDDIKLWNKDWRADISDSIVSADIDMQITAVTQLTLVVDDPKLEIFRKVSGKTGAPINYRNQKLSVAVLETGAGAGNGGFTITARPRVVRALKNRRGKHVMSNVSPSQFVEAEVKAVGGRVRTQESSKRSQVARDVKKKGDSSTDNNSSWTTFQRLAGEVGFVVFESEGVIWFGKPSWIMKNAKQFKVDWNLNATARNDKDPTEWPVCRKSDDDEENSKTVTLTIPLERAGDVFPGYCLRLSGVPHFNDRYLVQSVSYSLISKEGEVTVEAAIPRDPEATDPKGKNSDDSEDDD